MKPTLTQKYYYIGWPECQKIQELDPDGDHWSAAQDDEGVFAECEWIDELED